MLGVRNDEEFGRIKELNAHIYNISAERDFCEFIKENMRPQPEEYAKIRKRFRPSKGIVGKNLLKKRD